MKNNFNRLNDLFVGGIGAKTTGADVPKKVEDTSTQRTFKISNQYWDDFLILAKLLDKKQFELINELIKNAVLENQDTIEKYKGLK